LAASEGVRGGEIVEAFVTNFEQSGGCEIPVIGYGRLTGIRFHSVASQSGWTLSTADREFRVAHEREQFGGIHG